MKENDFTDTLSSRFRLKPYFRHVKELFEFVRDKKRNEYLLFWGHTPKDPGVVNHTCLSQWYPSPFQYGSSPEVYLTAEHFMMAEKARLFHDGKACDAILQAESPKEVKQIGRTVKNFDESQWRKSRMSVVIKGSFAKFSYPKNNALKDFLIGTHGKILVEASPVDKTWGIGLAQGHPDVRFPSKWQGKNLLGFALMFVREVLCEGKSFSLEELNALSVFLAE